MRARVIADDGVRLYLRNSPRHPSARPAGTIPNDAAMTEVLIIGPGCRSLEDLIAPLRAEGFEVRRVSGWEELLNSLEEGGPDLVLYPTPSSIVLFGPAYHFERAVGTDDLIALCHQFRESARAGSGGRVESAGRRARPSRPVGRSRIFTELLEVAELVAPTDSTVLITGESGTGKDVIARYIHNLSGRRDRAFVSINCGALPENLLESELFGHLEGSFTGAVRDKDGLLLVADGGTLFLDEVGEMAPPLQVKLLRVIQEREVVPIGATEPVPVDLRFIAATNRDLEEAVREGTFRADLYYRLNVVSLHLPPLRERVADIRPLVEHFLNSLAVRHGKEFEISERALSYLERYHWPGNTRELENALERASVLAPGNMIDLELLPARVREGEPPRLVAEEEMVNPTLAVIEKAYILWVLESEGGNKTRAAEVLGIAPSTLYRKLERYGIS